jgi:outer membrane immunogenic protein
MNSSRIYRRDVLLAGVSALALAAGSPEALAADLPKPSLYTKAPIAGDPPWTWWIEGAAFWTGGGKDRFVPPLGPGGSPLASFNGGPGWEGAIGVDYRFDPVWHVSADFRYGALTKKKPFAANFFTNTSGSANQITGNGTAAHREHHWAADFMVGRDVGLGGGKAQVKFGLRIAELSATANGQGVFNCFTPTGGTCGSAIAGSVTQRSKFLGIGPRVAIEGSNPLQGPWTFDYSLGIAGLFGDSNFSRNISASIPLPAGMSNVFIDNRNSAAFNADASAGLSYWMSPTSKLTVGYRFDGYWNALRSFSATGSVVNEAQIFHGPFLRLTGKFGSGTTADATARAAPASNFHWAGLYIGANAGYGWNDPTVTFTPNDPATVFFTCNGVGGCPSAASFNLGRALGGLQAGYNWLLSRGQLFGFETDFDWSRFRGRGSSTFGTFLVGPSNFVANQNIDWFGTIRARLGYFPADKWLAYATGGFAYGGVAEKLAFNVPGGFGIGTGGFGFTCLSGPNCFTGSTARIAPGWTAGGGVEYAAWSNVSVKAEYLYVSLDKDSFIANPANGNSSFTVSFSRPEFHVIRLGVNYLFATR